MKSLTKKELLEKLSLFPDHAKVHVGEQQTNEKGTIVMSNAIVGVEFNKVDNSVLLIEAK